VTDEVIMARYDAVIYEGAGSIASRTGPKMSRTDLRQH
jgi:hypothetical protein